MQKPYICSLRILPLQQDCLFPLTYRRKRPCPYRIIPGTWSPVGHQMAELGMTLVGGRVFFRNTELYKTLNAPSAASTAT